MADANHRPTSDWTRANAGSLTHLPHRNARTAAFEPGIGVNHSALLTRGGGREPGLARFVGSPDGTIGHDDSAAPSDLVAARGIGLAVFAGALLWLVLAALASGLPLRLWPWS